MLKFDFQNLMAESVGEKNGLTKNDLKDLSFLAEAAHNKLKSWQKTGDAFFLDAPFDEKILCGIKTKADEIAKNFENVVVLGIGGSALGLKCVAGALTPPFSNLKSKKGRGERPRLFVLDNIDPDTFTGALEIADPKETCFIVISKSGRTTETAAQFFIILKMLNERIKKGWRDHLVIITDPVAGELRPFVAKEGITSFPIAPKLGGRFSVISPVGLFPAACVGIDVEALVAGSKDMARKSADPSLALNNAYQIGAYNYLLASKKAKTISVMMPYADSLSLAADWFVQLWAESLGKSGLGQTPLKAQGATDQHSQVQLFMEGPSEKVFTFLGTLNFASVKNASKIEKVVGSFDYLKGHDLGSILNAEREATTSALTSVSRPNMTVTFPTIDAYHLGEFFMAYEIATAFAGALYGVNPFDQPGVELGKKLTREILSKR